MPNPIFINVADLIDPDDPAGRDDREINAAKVHNIPIGSLVEIADDPEYPREDAGARLFVVGHNRDCDRTPLYTLAMRPDERVYSDESRRFYSGKVRHGMPESSLIVVRGPGRFDAP